RETEQHGFSHWGSSQVALWWTRRLLPLCESSGPRPAQAGAHWLASARAPVRVRRKNGIHRGSIPLAERNAGDSRPICGGGGTKDSAARRNRRNQSEERPPNLAADRARRCPRA